MGWEVEPWRWGCWIGTECCLGGCDGSENERRSRCLEVVRGALRLAILGPALIMIVAGSWGFGARQKLGVLCMKVLRRPWETFDCEDGLCWCWREGVGEPAGKVKRDFGRN